MLLHFHTLVMFSLLKMKSAAINAINVTVGIHFLFFVFVYFDTRPLMVQIKKDNDPVILKKKQRENA